jgi:hypothetical protein
MRSSARECELADDSSRAEVEHGALKWLGARPSPASREKGIPYSAAAFTLATGGGARGASSCAGATCGPAAARVRR